MALSTRFPDAVLDQFGEGGAALSKGAGVSDAVGGETSLPDFLKAARAAIDANDAAKTSDVENDSTVVGASASDALETNAAAAVTNAAAVAALDMVEGVVTDVDLKDGGSTDYAITLNGTAGKRFIPTHVAAKCLTEDTLSGDAEIEVGNTLSGVEILAATTLTGLDTVDEVFLALAAAGIYDTAADGTIHVQVSSADSGTSGTCEVTVKGYEV